MGAALGMTGAGLVLGGIGAAIGSNAAQKAKEGLYGLSGTPGIDWQALTDESLTGMNKYFPTASALGTKLNDYYSGELNKLMETAYPGYSSQLGQYSGNTASMMRGEIPLDVGDQIFRSSAGRSLMGGYSGGGLHRNLVARDLGTTSYGIQQQGMNRFAAVPSTFPHATPVDVSQLMGLTPAQLVNMRSQERSQAIALRAAALGMPGSGTIMGNFMQSTGGAMAGAGSMGMLSGAGGMGSTGSGLGAGAYNSMGWDGSTFGGA